MNTPTNNSVLRRTEHRFYAEIITAIATRNERKDTKHENMHRTNPTTYNWGRPKETYRTSDTRHRTKTNKTKMQKTKKMSNKEPHKRTKTKPGVTSGVREG